MSTRVDAFQESIIRDLADLTDELVKNLGATVVASMTGKQRSTPYRWVRREVLPSADAERRLRLGYRVWKTVAQDQGENVALAWMVGSNPRLHEDTPVTAIREGRDADVIGAALAFIADTA